MYGHQKLAPLILSTSSGNIIYIPPLKPSIFHPQSTQNPKLEGTTSHPSIQQQKLTSHISPQSKLALLNPKQKQICASKNTPCAPTPTVRNTAVGWWCLDWLHVWRPRVLVLWRGMCLVMSARSCRMDECWVVSELLSYPVCSGFLSLFFFYLYTIYGFILGMWNR